MLDACPSLELSLSPCSIAAIGRRAASTYIPQAGTFPTAVGSPTVTQGTESLLISGAVSTDAIRGRLKSLPGGNFSVIVGVRGLMRDDELGFGILFRDSGGKFLAVANFQTGASNVSSDIMQFANINSYTSVLGTGRAQARGTIPIWLKATFTAATSDVEGFWSYTRDNWQSMGTSTHLDTADAFGIGLAQNVLSAAADQHAWFFHYEVV